MSSTYSGKLFLLGATGYLGSQFLIQLREQFPNVHVVALVRNATEERKATLAQLNPNLTLVEGSVEDEAIIREQTSKADITMNAATADHEKSRQATFAGLEDASKQRPGNPPIYIHVSGTAILSDNSKGEVGEISQIPKYVDTTFSVDDVPQTNMFVQANREIIAVGERKENPVKTLILLPNWIYGVGEGAQKISLPLRLYLNLAKAAGHAVTLGPGRNKLPPIHVKDVANTLVALVKGALDGTAGTGAQGLYFASGDFETAPTLKQIQDQVGDILHELGLTSEGKSKLIPSQLAGSLPDGVFDGFAGNLYAEPEKLRAQLGLEFTETKKLPFLQSLREEVKLAVKETGWTA
ncbi:hypothetical protein AX16_000064 [Volvariella volvacea WC 439]|nr:hypothetical protein AX16_000064 [Volvariella volvacea WC 439]